MLPVDLISGKKPTILLTFKALTPFILLDIYINYLSTNKSWHLKTTDVWKYRYLCSVYWSCVLKLHVFLVVVVSPHSTVENMLDISFLCCSLLLSFLCLAWFSDTNSTAESTTTTMTTTTTTTTPVPTTVVVTTGTSSYPRVPLFPRTDCHCYMY